MCVDYVNRRSNKNSAFYLSVSQNECDEYLKHLLITVLILHQKNLVFYVCDKNVLNILFVLKLVITVCLYERFYRE
jgi:hypothetical protein